MIKEIKLIELPFKPVSMFFGGLRPAVSKKLETGKYSIRIHTKSSYSGGYQSDSYDYFDLDETGLIIASPRGYASKYNKKVRIIDIREMAEFYLDKVVNN